MDTSQVRKLEDGKLRLLSGRVLDMAQFEPCEGDAYRVGIKRGYDLMPTSLETRTKASRKEKLEKIHREHVNGLTAKLEELNRRSAQPRDSEASTSADSKEREGEKEAKEELAAQIEQANALMSSYSDPGPLYDVVAWISSKDQSWRVIVDTRDDEEVENGILPSVLREFSKSGDFSDFGEQNRMNYSVNVWNEGNVVEIVTNAGSHGTHVAGIVGANFGENEENNGVAPGCQIISFKIGDSRLGSMETGVGFMRALLAARARGVHIINVSYGEPSVWANTGRIPDLINELVFENGIMFIASASNSGPCLTTTGAPGGSAFGAIPVGAVVTPSMMATQYSMRDAASRSLMPYNWSSRGPTADGYFGPSIAAPGGAIAPVPNWTLQKNQLMNGTSMSSPNACGCIALLLSAFKQMKVAYSPSSVRLAVENSAKKFEHHDYTSVGHGLIQVAAAYDFYMKNAAILARKVRYQATVSTNGGRGIYLRDSNHFSGSEIEESIQVDPIFPKKSTPSQDKIDIDTKFEIRSTMDYVKVPQFFQVAHGGRSFKIQITPPQLPPGLSEDGTHFLGEIYGVDMDHPELGAQWRIPVTIIRGVDVSPTLRTFSYNDLYCGPGELYRKFYQIPVGVTWATITINTKDWPYQRMALLSCQQLLPDQSGKHNLIDKYFSLKGNDERIVRVRLVAGLTFEVVVGQLWSAVGNEGRLSFSVEFSGVTVEASALGSSAGISTPASSSRYGEIMPLRLHNSMGSNVVQIKPVLCAVSRTLHPTSNPTPPRITPLHPDRDILAENKLIHQLVLTYHYTTEEANAKIILRSPFSTLLYDSPYEAQLIMVYDADKTLVKTVDFNPEWFALPTKGTYTIRMQLRHEDVSVLEKWKNLTIQLERQLGAGAGGGKDSKPITLSVHRTLASALGGPSHTWPSDGLRCVHSPHLPLYIVAPPASTNLPNFAKPGDVLLGYASLVKFKDAPAGKDKHFDDNGVNTRAPGHIAVKFVIPSKATKATAASASAAATADASNNANNNAAKAKEASSSASEANNAKNETQNSASTSSSTNTPSAAVKMLNAAALKFLADILSASKFTEWEERSKETLAVLPELARDADYKYQKVLYLDGVTQASSDSECKVELERACDELIATVDQTELAVYLGTRHPKETEEEKASVEKKKNHLVTGLSRKLRTKEVGTPEATALLDEVSKWVDPTTISTLSSYSTSKAADDRSGVGLRALRKKFVAGEKPSRAQLTELVTTLKALKWDHWAKYYETWITIRFSMEYQPF